MQHRTSDSALTRLINDARHARLLGPTALDELLTRCVRARALIDPHQRPTRSDLEDAFRRFCTRHRLPLPEINAVLADLKGREVDAFYRAERLIVEIDSFKFHNDLVIFARDRRKDSAALARGYATIRIPETEFDHDGTEQAQEIRSILADRRPRP